MSKLAVPDAPPSVRASDLIFGSDSDFVINAYLALQRQWPDAGGFAHYKYLLHTQPGARAQVLREISSSAMAKHRGSAFVDDLPADHIYKVEQHDPKRFQELSLALRVGQTIVDVDRLNQAVSKMTLEGLTGAVETIVQAQQANQAALESQLNGVASTVRALESKTTVASADPNTAATQDTAVPAWLQYEWQRMAQRHMSLEQQVIDSRQVLDGLRADVSEMKETIQNLRHFASVELKRQVADYVTAYASVTQQPTHSMPKGPSTPTPTSKQVRPRRHA
jgi:hypothetical protein